MSVDSAHWWRTEDAELARIERRIETEGLCAQGTRDPEGWFPPISSRPRSDEDQRQSLGEASRQCSSELFGPCPVRELCAQAALARGEEHGIWGGLPGWVLRQLRSKPARLKEWHRTADKVAAEIAAADNQTKSTDKNTARPPRLAA